MLFSRSLTTSIKIETMTMMKIEEKNQSKRALFIPMITAGKRNTVIRAGSMTEETKVRRKMKRLKLGDFNNRIAKTILKI